MEIIVEDNGVGIDEETLRKLAGSLNESFSGDYEQSHANETAGRRGIGLQNVHQRIRLMFGEGFGVRIESRKNLGTTVVVTIPIPPERG